MKLLITAFEPFGGAETNYAHQPLALQTPLPIKELVNFCTGNVLPIQISNSAGLYVCNRVYYEALHLQQNALFVHVPKNMDLTLAQQTIAQIKKNLSH